MEIEPSNVQEEEKVEEMDKKMELDPEPMKPDEQLEHMSCKEDVNAICVSALDMILKSMWYINVFTQELAKSHVPDLSFIEHESIFQPLQQLLFMYGPEEIVDELNQELYDLLLDDLISALHVTHPVINTISDLWVVIIELLYLWRSQNGKKRLNFHFKVNEAAVKMICSRCRKKTDYPFERSYGLIISAYVLRETKAALEEFSFESILKIIRITLKMPCDVKRGGCGKRNYAPRVLDKLPSVFPIVLEWEYNETEEQMSATSSILTPEIDISEIYQYDGVSSLTKYQLVSMLCLNGERYNCIAYENGSWVRHFRSEQEDCLNEIKYTNEASKEKTRVPKKEEIGDWQKVLSCFRKLNIRPEILFFENVTKEENLSQC